MSKIRTAMELQDLLDTEMGWRIKELAAMKASARRSNGTDQAALVRAALALLYAHWEGFVKATAAAYLNYVNTQGLQYHQLQNCFVVFGVKKMLNELKQSKSASENIAAVEFLRERMGETAKLKFDSAINTESNLSSSVLHNILVSLGISTTSYEAKYNLIDESLLRRRNSIAHGDYLDVDLDEWSELSDEIIAMLRQLKTDIQNATALGSFKKAA